MRIKYLKTPCFYLLLFCWNFAVCLVTPLKGDEQNLGDLSAKMDEFIYSEEFKAAERAELRALPVESVELLSERLKRLSVDSPTEIHIFACLAFKLNQFKSDLSPAAKDDAISSLEAKMKDEKSPTHSYRLQLYNAALAPPSKTDESSPFGSESVSNSQALVQPQAPQNAPIQKPIYPMQCDEPKTSTRWSMPVAVTVVGAFGILWMLLKMRN